MAASGGKKTSSSNSGGSNRKSTGTRQIESRKTTEDPEQLARDSALFHEIGLIVLFAAMVFLFLCNFGIIGPFGDSVSGFLFGVFGLTAYVVPILIFLATAFWFANEGNPNAMRKLISGIVLFLMVGVICEMIAGNTDSMSSYQIGMLYENCRDTHSGGGVLAGSI